MQIKVAFEIDATRWHSVAVETMWASLRDSNSAVLDSVPFFARGVSYQDAVEVTQAPNQSWLFKKVLSPSGHSTYRIRFSGSEEEAVNNLLTAALEDAGCIIERGEHGGFLLWAISIPPPADADSVYQLLEAAAGKSLIEIEEGNDVHPE